MTLSTPYEGSVVATDRGGAISDWARVLLFALLPLFLPADLSGQAPASNSQPVLTSIKEIRNLTPEEAGRNYRVRLRGVVAARWRQRNLLFLVQGTEAVSLYAPGTNGAVVAGQTVEIEGLTVPDSGVHVIIEKLTPLGEPGPLPVAEELSLRDLNAGEFVFRRVKVQGVVQNVRFGAGRQGRFRVGLTLRERGDTFPISVRRESGLGTDDYRYAQLAVTGLIIKAEGAAGRGNRILWVDNTNSFEFLKPAPKNPFTRAVRPVADLEAFRDKERLPQQLMHFRGVVDELTEDGDYWLADGTGRVRFQQRRSDMLREGDAGGVVGFVARQDEELYLASCTARVLAHPTGGGFDPRDYSALTNFVPAIASVADLRRLSADKLATGWPVRFRAFATYLDRPGRLFVGTVSGGTEVHFDMLPEDLRPGDNVEIGGLVKAGPSGPIVSATTVEKKPPATGSGGRLPAPIRLSPGSLVTGKLQSQWVQADGLVRRVDAGTNELRLLVARFGMKVGVRVQLAGETAPPDLLDAKVTLQGVADLMRGADVQARDVQVLVSSLREVTVDERLPSGRGAGLKITDMLSPAAGPVTYPRTIAGTVVYRGKDRMFVADNSASVEVVPLETGDAGTGDRVSVTGYPVIAGAKP